MAITRAPTAILHQGTKPDVLLTRAKSLAGLVERNAEATELQTSMTPEVFKALRESGLFWMLLPESLGGSGIDLVNTIEILEEISRADASTGWSLMANSCSTAIAAGFLGQAAIERIFAGPDVPIMAGMLGPNGKAKKVDGGYIGSGHYSFGSGCAHADWFGAGMFVMDADIPKMVDARTPEVRVAFVSRDNVQVLGNWDVIGLVGTGSYDYQVPEQFIPDAYTLERTCVVPERGGHWFSLGIAGISCAGHSAVALGLMKRALEEISEMARTKKRPLYPAVLAEHPLFKQDFCFHEATYWAARDLILDVFRTGQDEALRPAGVSALQRARIRQATTWIHRIASDVVRACHMWGGSQAIRNPTVLGRCMRDMHVATNHVFVDPITLVDAAPAILESWNKRSGADHDGWQAGTI